MKTTAAILHDPHGELFLESVTLDNPRDDEVIVKIEACGICQLDIEARKMLPTPSVFGHEGVGVVLEVGSAVRGFHPGQRVIVSYAWCGTCPKCEQHQAYICDKSWEINFGGSRLDGSATLFQDDKPLSASFFQQSSFARHILTTERNLVTVTGDTPTEYLAALPCGVMTGAGIVINTLDVQPSKSLVIFGAGTVGLSAVMAARIVGAKSIVAVDVVESRLALARELGATHCFNAQEVNIKEVLESHFPSGLSYAIETSAKAQSFTAAIDCIETGGKIAISSLPHPMEEFSFKPFNLYEKAASLHAISMGSAIAAEFIPQLLKWQREGNFPFEKLITCYDFQDINRACADMRSGKTIKAVLKM